MKNLKVLFLLTFLTTSIFAQWAEVNSGTSDRLWVVDFANETNAVIGSSDANGTFLISDDAGENWTDHNTGEEYRFYDIDMLDENNGRACGYGVFMITENGGESWNFTEVNGTTFIQALDFINENTGWIVGFQGMIKKTTDAGQNWTTQETGVPHDIWEITAINENLIFAAGRNTVTEKGMFFITTDGGENWQTEEVPYQLMSVACINDQKWFAGGEQGILYYTDNAGETWTNETIIPSTNIMEIKFIDQNNGFLMCYDDDDPYSPDSYIYKTTDGGQNWELSYQANSKKMYSIAFSSPYHGIACGADGRIWLYDEEYQNIQKNNYEYFNIYPNPSNGTFSITNYESQITSIEINDITGKIIHKSEFVIPNSQFVINKKGIYFIKIKTETGIYTKIIIIQ